MRLREQSLNPVPHTRPLCFAHDSREGDSKPYHTLQEGDLLPLKPVEPAKPCQHHTTLLSCWGNLGCSTGENFRAASPHRHVYLAPQLQQPSFHLRSWHPLWRSCGGKHHHGTVSKTVQAHTCPTKSDTIIPAIPPTFWQVPFVSVAHPVPAKMSL